MPLRGLYANPCLKDGERLLSPGPSIEQQSISTCYLPEMTKNSKEVREYSSDMPYTDVDSQNSTTNCWANNGKQRKVFKWSCKCSGLLPISSHNTHLPSCEGGLRTELCSALSSLQPLTVSALQMLSVIAGFKEIYVSHNITLRCKPTTHLVSDRRTLTYHFLAKRKKKWFPGHFER